MENERIIDRILRLIAEIGISDIAFCRGIGVAQSTFANWKARGTDPNSTYIANIAKILGVSEKYILTGEEEVETNQEYYIDPETAALAQEIFDNPELRILFDATRNVSKEDLAVVVQIAQRLKK